MLNDSKPYLSIIIPCYNEADRIGQTLVNIRLYLAKQNYLAEIIVSDDGSSDETLTIAEQTLQGCDYKILPSSRNRGKGYAVRVGMMAASGEVLLFSDADLSTPISELDRFLTAIKQHDIIIGSRTIAGANILVKQPFSRQIVGKIFSYLVISLLSLKTLDSQCGFKCFTKTAAKAIFFQQQLEGFCFDVEILFLAKKLQLSVLEVPVTWENSPLSKVSVLRDSVLMFLDLLRIRWMHRNTTITRASYVSEN